MDLEILNIASDTNNNKNLKNHTHNSKLKNSICGDEVKIKLIIKNNRIIDFGHQGESCIYCQASLSLLSKVCINNKIDKIKELCNKSKFMFEDNPGCIDKDWLLLKKLFKKENMARKECILLPFKTLNKIVSK